MSMRACFIDLPCPSMRTSNVTSFFDDPKNPDNIGFWRCGECYTRFSAKMTRDQMTEHLKLHPEKWQRFMNIIKNSLSVELDSPSLIKEDRLKSNDLKLVVGITHEDLNIVIRLPKSRVPRRRFKSTRWNEQNQSWNRKISEEYQNNPIGGYQGNFDKPICDKEVEFLHCGNWLISFQDFVTYRHEPTGVCINFDINKEKYQGLDNRVKIESYFIKGVPTKSIFGPTSSIDNESVSYTCNNSMCIFPCLCSICVLQKDQCQEHKLLHPGFFDADNDFFTVRNSDSFNITVNNWQRTTDNVYKYAGIPRSCHNCSDDVYHHQAFHFVFHSSCKFCRVSRFRFDGVQTEKHFKRRLEILKEQEELSCHFCNKNFSDSEDKNRHIEIVHYKNVGKQFQCAQCNHIVYSKQALNYHVQTKHNEDNKRPRFKCNFCDKLFHVQHSLNVHVRYAHELKRVPCVYCKESFKKKSNLDSHMKFVHDTFTHNIFTDEECEIELFECDSCSFQTRYQSNFRRHVNNAHRTSKTFSCTECNFKTVYMNNLQNHMKNIHEKEEKLSCELCTFATRYKRNLDSHIEIVHRGVKKHKCQDCDFSTAYHRNLVRHCKEVHDI